MVILSPFYVYLTMFLKESKLGEVLRSYAELDESVIWKKTFSDVQFQEWILNMIRMDQLYEQGIDATGNVIGYYSAFTQMLNPEKVQGEHYTLKDTGDFYRSMVLHIYENYIEIDADAIKIDRITGQETNLFLKYGEEIVGLTEENLEKVRQQIKQRYIEEVRNTLL